LLLLLHHHHNECGAAATLLLFHLVCVAHTLLSLAWFEGGGGKWRAGTVYQRATTSQPSQPSQQRNATQHTPMYSRLFVVVSHINKYMLHITDRQTSIDRSIDLSLSLST
jgi:hypothetical protein